MASSTLTPGSHTFGSSFEPLKIFWILFRKKRKEREKEKDRDKFERKKKRKKKKFGFQTRNTDHRNHHCNNWCVIHKG